MARRQVAVVGAGEAGEELCAQAFRVGAALAAAGAVVLTGGRGGVMAAASAGARSAGGLVVGVLPGDSPAASPPAEAVELAIYTGFGQGRNLVLVLSAGAVVAVGGGWGTLSEIALALKHRIPVVTLASWRLALPDGGPEPLLVAAADPEEAAALALARHRRL